MGKKGGSMKRKFLISMTVGMFLFGNSVTSQASLTVKDDDVWGGGAIIHDSSTGLDWLKPYYTVNQSFSEVNRKINNETYGNFRYATYDEVVSLFVNSGLYFGSIGAEVYAGGAMYWQNTYSFVTQFGPTYSQKWIAENWLGVSGIMSSNVNNEPLYANAKYGFWNWGQPLDSSTEIGNVADENYSSALTGSWLVRTNIAPVPAPNSLYLLSIGIIGICGLSRRKYSY